MKYAWIKSHRDSFPVKTMCRVLRVSSSGYYGWLKSKHQLYHRGARRAMPILNRNEWQQHLRKLF